jgi:multiple sugar transport system permease protein
MDFSTLTLRLWDFTGVALINLFILIIVVVYLSPLTYMLATSLKTSGQLSDSRSPVWPAQAVTYDYEGRTLNIYDVPTDDGVKQWALVKPHTRYSEFIDPAHPEQGLITWNGSWRALLKVYRPHFAFNNFATLWDRIDYPQLLRNTMIVIVLGEIGVLCASIAVAYGFSRFRMPGGKFLFFLLIATITIPDSITLVPSFYINYRILNWLHNFWISDAVYFLPLIVPHFFGSAIYIFLLRQNFKAIPRDLDEAAMIDGAGPMRTLISIVLPQAIPVVATVALLQFFNAWNELRMASLYLSTSQQRTMAFSAQAFISYGFTPEFLQASALLLMVVPVIVLLLSQRFFMQDMVVTGIEK